jgi:hypothetical protein
MDTRVNPRASKRQRTGSSSSSEHGPQVKHSNPWFDDGNVILQAELAQFKVYSGILSSKSEVFRDMFSLPQPVGVDEVVEECPVVCLSDTAEDVRYVLEALYNGRLAETPHSGLGHGH